MANINKQMKQQFEVMIAERDQLLKENTRMSLEITGKYGLAHLREWNGRLRNIASKHNKQLTTATDRIKVLEGALKHIADDNGYTGEDARAYIRIATEALQGEGEKE